MTLESFGIPISNCKEDIHILEDKGFYTLNILCLPDSKRTYSSAGIVAAFTMDGLINLRDKINEMLDKATTE